MTITDLEPGSGPYRVCVHLKHNRGAILDRLFLSQFLNVPIGAMETVLRPAIDRALITVANDGDAGRVWLAGPRLSEWAPATKGTASSSTKAATATTAPDPRGGKRSMLPALDVSKLTVHKDLPSPRRSNPKGVTRHDAVFDLLTADGTSVTGIERRYRAALDKAAQTYLQHRPALRATSVLRVSHVDDTTCGVWRLPKPAPAASAAAAAGAATANTPIKRAA